MRYIRQAAPWMEIGVRLNDIACQMDVTGDAAKQAVGSDAPSDWQLKPETHALSLPPNAGALKRILERDIFRRTIEAFRIDDAAAVSSRKWYVFYAGWAALLSLVSIVCASTLLTVFGLNPSKNDPLVTHLSIIIGVSVSLSFILSLLEKWVDPAQKWMASRAAAENERMRLFNEVVAANEPVKANELALPPLQLEYFRRYQLDVQRRYYEGRGAQHRAVVRWSVGLRIVALLLVLTASLPQISTLAGYPMADWLGHAIDPDLQTRIFVGLSTAGAALQGWLAAQLLMGLDERNAVRYASTAANLIALSGRPLDEAREAAANGDRQAVLGFVALVQEQVSSEHREWISLKQLSPELSLSRLRKLALPRLV